MEILSRIIEKLILTELERGQALDYAIGDIAQRFNGVDLDAAIGQLTQLQSRLSAAHKAATDLGLDADDAASLTLD
jgi:hypothetical protein